MKFNPMFGFLGLIFLSACEDSNGLPGNGGSRGMGASGPCPQYQGNYDCESKVGDPGIHSIHVSTRPISNTTAEYTVRGLSKPSKAPMVVMADGLEHSQENEIYRLTCVPGGMEYQSMSQIFGSQWKIEASIKTGGRADIVIDFKSDFGDGDSIQDQILCRRR